MGCSLINKTKEEHAKMTSPLYSTRIIMCPVLGRQICMWCCLHISDLASPVKRNQTMKNFSKYAEVVTELSGRTLDDIYETCSSCRQA